jgi:hypothetical protein
MVHYFVRKLHWTNVGNISWQCAPFISLHVLIVGEDYRSQAKYLSFIITLMLAPLIQEVQLCKQTCQKSITCSTTCWISCCAYKNPPTQMAILFNTFVICARMSQLSPSSYRFLKFLCILLIFMYLWGMPNLLHIGTLLLLFQHPSHF